LDTHSGGHRFESLVPQWRLSAQAVANFKYATGKLLRDAAQQCFGMMANHCTETESLCVRGWMMFERHAIPSITWGFPQLRHLEVISCDMISSYDALLPIFREHPGLLSLRATFKPSAAASMAFVHAAPAGLKALGFVSFEAPEVAEALLKKCTELKHLWFAPTSKFPNGMVQALDAGGSQRLLTLSLPSYLSDRACAEVAERCPRLQLLCRMRIGSPPFGSGPLEQDFELLPSGHGVVLRRRGSNAELAPNNALWAPHSRNDADDDVTGPTPQLSLTSGGAGREGSTAASWEKVKPACKAPLVLPPRSAAHRAVLRRTYGLARPTGGQIAAAAAARRERTSAVVAADVRGGYPG